jgi:hypothetical protein
MYTQFSGFVQQERKRTMFEERLNSTRSVARKLAREILPEEMDVIAAGTGTCSGCPEEVDDCDHDSLEPI